MHKSLSACCNSGKRKVKSESQEVEASQRCDIKQGILGIPVRARKCVHAVESAKTESDSDWTAVIAVSLFHFDVFVDFST